MRPPSRTPLPALSPLLALLASAACGPAAVSPEEASGAMASALCENLERCNLLGPWAGWPEGLDCASMMETSYVVEALTLGGAPLEELAGSERVRYDAKEMGRCIEGIRTLDCYDLNHLALPPACGNFIEGTVEPGGTCYTFLDCAGGRCGGGYACPGTCEALPGLGEDCEWSCAEGYCSSRGMCEPWVELGEACRSDVACLEGACTNGYCRLEGGLSRTCTDWRDCREGLYCAAIPGASHRACRELPEDDVPCMDRSDCPWSAPICVLHGSEGHCASVEARSIAGAGIACDPTGLENALCEPGLACARTADGTAHVCRAPVAAGEPCTPAYPSLCPSGHYCAPTGSDGSVEGTCRPLPSDGEPCLYDEDYGLTYCAQGSRCDYYASTPVCVRIEESGASCTSDFGCATNQCNDGVCGFDPCSPWMAY